MPKVSKFSEEQIKGFLAKAFGAKCGGEGEGAGVEPVSTEAGVGQNTLYIWKRKYFPDQTVARAPRKVIRKTVKPAAKVVASNGASTGDAATMLKRLFVRWVESELKI